MNCHETKQLSNFLTNLFKGKDLDITAKYTDVIKVLEKCVNSTKDPTPYPIIYRCYQGCFAYSRMFQAYALNPVNDVDLFKHRNRGWDDGCVVASENRPNRFHYDAIVQFGKKIVLQGYKRSNEKYFRQKYNYILEWFKRGETKFRIDSGDSFEDVDLVNPLAAREWDYNWEGILFDTIEMKWYDPFLGSVQDIEPNLLLETFIAVGLDQASCCMNFDVEWIPGYATYEISSDERHEIIILKPFFSVVEPARVTLI